MTSTNKYKKSETTVKRLIPYFSRVYLIVKVLLRRAESYNIRPAFTSTRSLHIYIWRNWVSKVEMHVVIIWRNQYGKKYMKQTRNSSKAARSSPRGDPRFVTVSHCNTAESDFSISNLTTGLASALPRNSESPWKTKKPTKVVVDEIEHAYSLLLQQHTTFYYYTTTTTTNTIYCFQLFD